MTDTDTRTTLADDLRAVADWVERHPEVRFYGGLDIIPSDAEEFATIALALADGAPLGSVRKDLDSSVAHVIRYFGAIPVDSYVLRHVVCEQVEVGTETVDEPDAGSVEAQRVADLERQLDEARSAVPTTPIERPKLEWQCTPLLSRDRLATEAENRAGIAAAKATLGHGLSPEAADDADDRADDHRMAVGEYGRCFDGEPADESVEPF